MDIVNYFLWIFTSWLLFRIVSFLWRKWDSVVIAVSILPRDLELLNLLFCQMIPTWLWRRLNNETIFKSLDKLVKKHPHKVCFYFEDEQWTFKQVQEMSFQVGNYFQEKGLRKGDVVALGMNNRPEMVCLWVGLSRIGVITALINYNLIGDTLLHCMSTSNCKVVIIGREIRDALMEIWDGNATPIYEMDRYHKILVSKSKQLTSELSPIVENDTIKIVNLAICLQKTSSRATVTLPNEEPNFMDNLFYVFTSGTTGLPKQAKISHSRFAYLGGATGLVKLTPEDILYCPLPMYHLLANYGIAWSFTRGASVVISSSFSASRFWTDIRHHKATCFLYMGEICRFLLKQPRQDSQTERSHTIRAMVGVGLKPEVWQEFHDRFRIPKVVETYGSTEGNCTLLNMEGTKVGAVGYIPIWLQPIFPGQIIKVHPVTGEICRDEKTGFAIKCEVDEAGELMGKIVNKSPSSSFDGYTDKTETEKKIARDVFRKGDNYFRTGDFLCKDRQGYVYFRDRMGDTFRWKGENVSTAEVEGVVLKLTGMKTNVVYGVTIPKTEGKAGMLAILDVDGNLDLEKLQHGMEKSLPKYARPVFIRCIRNTNGIQMTGTYKLQKFQLVQQGFDLEQVTDLIYVFSATSQLYIKLDHETVTEIQEGIFRL